MHGIMEGPGEELQVAAVTADDHHHHHNGVSASPSPSPSPVLNGESASPKDGRSPALPVSPPAPTSPEAENGVTEHVPKVDPAPEVAENDAKDKNVKQEETPSVNSNTNEEITVDAEKEPAVESPNQEEIPKVKGEPTLNDNLTEDKENANQEVEAEKETKPVSSPQTNIKTENLLIDGCADAANPEVVSDETGVIENEVVDENVQPEDGSADVGVKSTCTEASENEKENISLKLDETEEGVPAREPMDNEVPCTTVTTPAAEDENKLTDDEKMETETTPVVGQTEERLITDKEDAGDKTVEQRPASVNQKRSSSEDSDSSQTKKKSRSDGIDSNALDLTSIRKSEPQTNEGRIAIKPQSLLLSKLQSGADKNKNDSHKLDDCTIPSKKLGESLKGVKPATVTSRSERRRSRDEKERTNARRRSSESSSLRAAERDQALREMRDRVLSSYKEQRASKDECFLRDLLEPERDALLSDLVEAATQNGGMPELDRVCNLLNADIRQLNVQLSTKEMEWNELLRKRKLKEELCSRLERRKQVLLVTGECDDDRERNNTYEEEMRPEPRRESRLEARLEGRHDIRRDMPSKSGEELLATALRLGSRNIEDYHHQQGNGGSSPLAVRIQARANELLAGTTPPLERKSSGPLPGLSQMLPHSLLQSQLSQPSELSSSSPQSQFLLQHLQRQRVLMNASSSVGSACRLSPSVSLSAIPTSTTSSPSLNPSLASSASPCSKVPIPPLHTGKQHSRTQRPILPKPSTSTSGGHVVSDASLDASGAGVIGEGRQGPILDVKSIIADYRSKHPEGVPRRGRRLKPNSLVPENLVASARPGSSSGGGLLSMSLPALGSGSHVRTGSAAVDLSELGFVLTSGAGSDGPSRPSSTESSLSGAASQLNQDTGMSFKDVLVQFAKMTSASDQNSMNSSSNMLGRPPPPPYPEVTLHPVVAPISSASPAPVTSTPTTSLLHGILTKSNSQSANGNSQSLAKPTTFSPTLARLLTAPERSSSSSAGSSGTSSMAPSYPSASVTMNYPTMGGSGPVLLSDLLSGTSTNKARGELTITPVTGSSAPSQSHASQAGSRTNQEIVVLDGEDHMDVNGDEADGDTDSDERRLVIDEGESGEPEINSEPTKRAAIPHCQGCNERDAEFVCAGCQNQWYCSRECQIAAWDEHSELCFPPNPS